MRVLGLTVGRNEADRYLVPMLKHMGGVLDKHFFFDDQSDDRTPYLVAEYSQAYLVRRMDDEASFVENEGAFRAAAWQAFEAYLAPQVGDWVLVIDCDEVLVPRELTGQIEKFGLAKMTRTWLESAIYGTSAPIVLSIPEVWGFAEDGRPLIRNDGQWGNIFAPRLFPYQPGAAFAQGGFGTPAVPSYVQARQPAQTERLYLMHYGYADRRDWKAKYERYSGHLGHSNAHVESIKDRRQMETYTWALPYVKEMRRAPDS